MANSNSDIPGFNVGNFKSYLNGTGYLPVSRYYLEIVTPPILQDTNTVFVGGESLDARAFEKDLTFRAESLEAPGITLNYTNVNRYGVGPQQKFAYNAQFTDISVAFLADKQSKLWSYFYAWLNNIFQYSSDDNGNGDYSSYRANYMKDYATDVFIHVYDVDRKLSTKIKLIDAYPISMNEVRLAWDLANQNMKITVKFTFRHWLMDDTTVMTIPRTTDSPNRLFVPRSAQTIQSVQPTPKPLSILPQEKRLQDSMQNHLNDKGNFNNPTVPDGTQTPSFHMGA